MIPTATMTKPDPVHDKSTDSDSLDAKDEYGEDFGLTCQCAHIVIQWHITESSDRGGNSYHSHASAKFVIQHLRIR